MVYSTLVFTHFYKKFSLFTFTMQLHFRLLKSFFHFHNEYIFTIKTSPVRWYSTWFFSNISLRNAVRRKILYDSNKKSNKIIQTMKNYKTMAFWNSRYKYQFLKSLFTILIHAKFRILSSEFNFLNIPLIGSFSTFLDFK